MNDRFDNAYKSIGEVAKLLNLVNLKWDSWNQNLWSSMIDDLKIPKAGRRIWNISWYEAQWSDWFYWATDYDSNYAKHIYISNNDISPSNIWNRSYGYSVRCFKN